ncbi:internexin neuronal intermediate filament protein%2C alpha b [Scomber scombrus]|uniref:Internexin neuronal intermediate filament protein, alpha b n=1 Tax=Scomber scombrus TaxID=13677 RepID=A0AAV1NTK2_SCOSC
MSYGPEVFSASSYRRIFGASPRYASSPSRMNVTPKAGYRKLLEGEETRIGTGMSYPSPSMSSGGGQSYSYQTRMYSSPAKSSKKESKDEDQQQNKAGSKVSQREVYEETVVTTKMEKQQDSGDIPTNQKN